MENAIGFPSLHGLEHHGLRNLDTVYWTLPSPALVERIVRRREGLLAHLGPVVVRTGHHTGRSPNDKFIVQDGKIDSEIWWGTVNRPMDEARFERLALRLTAYFQGREVYVQDVVACAHPSSQVPVRVSRRRHGTVCSLGTCSCGFLSNSWPTMSPALPSSMPALPCHPRGRRHQLRSLHRHQFQRG